MDDIYSKLSKAVEEISSIKGSTGYNLTDVYKTLSNIEDHTHSA